MAASKTIVTDIGKAKIAQAAATGTTVKLKYFAVGDGAGSEYTPTGKEDRLLGENWRSNIDSIVVNKTDPKELFIDTVVPENVGGWWVREYGVFDEDNSLILIGTINQVYKSTLEEGDIIAFDFNLSVILQNVSNIEYVIDLASYVSFDFLLNANYEVTGQVDHRNRLKITSASGDNRVAVIQDILNLYKINVSVQPATEILGTSLRANGTLDALGISTNIVQAGFEYRLTGSQTWQRSSLSDMTATGNFTAVISGLIKNTTYDLRAIGINKQHSGNIGYSEIINVTTANLNPQVDSVINITGTTDSSSNSALTTVTVPEISNGHVVAGAAIADADNCISQTLEISQAADKSDLIGIQTTFALNPRKLNILPETTKDSIVLSSPLAGLLSNGSSLWVDDGVTIKDVTAVNVVETKTRGTPSAASTDGLSTILYCSFTDGDNAYTVSSTQTWSQQGQFYYTYLYITKVGVAGTYQAISSSYLEAHIFTDAVIYEANGVTYLAAFATKGGMLVYKWDIATKFFIRDAASDPTSTPNIASLCIANISNVNYVLAASWFKYNAQVSYSISKYTIGTNGKLTLLNTSSFFGVENYEQSLKSFNYQNDTYLVQGLSGTTHIYKYNNTDATWGLVQTITNRYYPVVTTDNDGTNYLATLVTNSAVFEIRKWDGTQFPASSAALTDTISAPLASGSCNIVYQGAKSFGFGNYLVMGFVDINKYTCTGLSPALTGAPTWVAKAGQRFASSISITAGTTNYVTTTADNIVRVDDTLIMLMKQQNLTGRYTRLQAAINNGDQMVRYAADLYINQTTPRSDGHYLPCGYEVLKPNEHLGYSNDDIADFENRHKQEQQASLAEIARERLNESQLYAHDHSLTQAQKEELAEYNGSLILIIRGELASLPAEPVWFYL